MLFLGGYYQTLVKPLKSFERYVYRYRLGIFVKIVTMLDKPEGRTVEIGSRLLHVLQLNEFVVGYGLDYIYKNYRNLSFVGGWKSSLLK